MLFRNLNLLLNIEFISVFTYADNNIDNEDKYKHLIAKTNFENLDLSVIWGYDPKLRAV